MMRGMITGVSQATATRVYLSLYKPTDSRTNATAQIGSLAAGLLLMQAGNGLMRSSGLGLPTATGPKMANNSPIDLGEVWRNIRVPVIAGVGGAALGYALNSSNRTAGALIGAGVGADHGG